MVLLFHLPDVLQIDEVFRLLTKKCTYNPPRQFRRMYTHHWWTSQILTIVDVVKTSQPIWFKLFGSVVSEEKIEIWKFTMSMYKNVGQET